MQEFSTEEIRRFLDPFQFSRPRIGDKFKQSSDEIDPFGESRAITESAEQSTNLLRSAFSRVERILSNLATAKNLAEEASDLTDSEKRDESYGKIRSLLAGIDILTDQSRFGTERVLDGSPLNLVGGVGSRQTSELQLQNFFTFGDDGMGLTKMVKDARVQHFFAEFTGQLNANSPLRGISISSVDFAEIQDGKTELEDADYRIQVDYDGANSTVHLTDSTLDPIISIEDVDLSGDGEETVDFGVGLEITFSKTTSTSPFGVDKFDPNTDDGRPVYYADLTYIPIYRPELFVANASKEVQAASLSDAEDVTTDDGNTLSFAKPDITTASSSALQVEDGKYKVQVNYFGASSSITLRDEQDRLIDFIAGDLSGSETKVTFDNGLTVNFENSGVGNQAESLSTTIEVKTTKQEQIDGGIDVSLGATTGDSNSNGAISLLSASQGDAEQGEDTLKLEDHTIDVRYYGKNSNVTIRDAEGNRVYFEAGIDLSAVGDSEVTLKNGLELKFNNTGFGDFEVGKISGALSVEKATLEAGDALPTIAASAEITDSKSSDDRDGVGELKVLSMETASVGLDEEELEAGTYNISVTYLGQNSTVSLRDGDGRLLKFVSGVDLTTDTDTVINFQNGVKAVLRHSGFDDNLKTATADFKYTPEVTGSSANFDFESFSAQIDAAIESTKEQINLMDETFVRINRALTLQQIAQDLSANGASSGVNAITLLSSAVRSDTAALFRPASANSQASQNIQLILARANAGQEPGSFSAADLVSAAGNQNPNSIFGILSRSAQVDTSSSGFDFDGSSDEDPTFEDGDDEDS